MKLLQEGDIFELQDGDTVYSQVPEHFVYENRKGHFDLTQHEITCGNVWTHLRQRFVVVKTTHDGGGRGHGPHDVYQDGHHVFARSLEDGDVKINFYQTGSFTAMIDREVEVLSRATLTWVEGERDQDEECD